METWPAALPSDILSSGFKQQAKSNTIRSTVEAGLDKIRRRYTTPIVDSTVTMVMTFAQHDTLETFFNTTLQGGVLSFGFTDPITSTLSEYRFLIEPSYSSVGCSKLLVSMQWERIG